ncbi:MAG: nuclear transport factor 2 family protein [Cyanobacterium sp. T60_A2020_053]|nr:nuclear transport factor 2 family protein [Cyanobacterium sp. T60_A2020_053]
MIKNSRNFKKILRSSFLLLVSSYFFINNNKPIEAQNNQEAEIRALISNISLASSQENLMEIKNYLSPEFSSEDGLNNESYLQILESFWQQYDNLKYTTVINNIKTQGNQVIAEITTNIEGINNNNGQPLNLKTEISARQIFENNQLRQEEIIREKNQITTGANPPEIMLRLPTQARLGETFDFDAIIPAPLAGGLLIGGVKEEKITPDLKLNPESIELEALSTGGIFKRVTMDEGNHWYSAIFIRADGMTLITQRVRQES